MAKLPEVDIVDFELSKDTIHYVPSHTKYASPEKAKILVKQTVDDKVIKKILKELKAEKRKSLALINSLESYKRSAEYHKRTAEKLARHNQELVQHNKRLLQIMNAVKQEHEQTKIFFNMRLQTYEKEYNKNMAKTIQKHMHKQLALQSEIESLKEKLAVLYESLEEERIKYKQREQKLKKILS